MSMDGVGGKGEGVRIILREREMAVQVAHGRTKHEVGNESSKAS